MPRLPNSKELTKEKNGKKKSLQVYVRSPSNLKVQEKPLQTFLGELISELLECIAVRTQVKKDIQFTNILQRQSIHEQHNKKKKLSFQPKEGDKATKVQEVTESEKTEKMLLMVKVSKKNRIQGNR